MAKSSLELTGPQRDLLRRLARNWNASGAARDLLKGFDPDLPDECKAHPFFPEVANLSIGEPASFPFLAPNVVHWLLIAPNQRKLLEGITALRSWILPSFGWEDDNPVVGPNDRTSELGTVLLEVSPAGYFRWRSQKEALDRVIRKLSQIRQLNRAKPDIAYQEVSSVVELRQRFRLALSLGDRNAAEAIVNRIDASALDTAINTAFMRVRIASAFDDHHAIIASPALDNLLRVPMPLSVQAAILRAFYTVFLDREIEQSNWPGVLKAYKDSVHSKLSALIARADAKHDLYALRMAACLAVEQQDVVRGAMITQMSSDTAAKAIIAALHKSVSDKSALTEFFEHAWRMQDWTGVQYAGVQLLSADDLSAETHDSIRYVLRRSLAEIPNVDVERFLNESTEQIGVEGPAESIPQNWQEFSSAIVNSDFEPAYQFVTLEARPSPELATVGDVEKLRALVEDVLTNPELHNYRGVNLAELAASALIEDLVRQPAFPDSRFKDIYFSLFQFWALSQKRSGRTEDEAAFLYLASGLLERSLEVIPNVVAAAGAWWASRRNRARLGFVVEVLELVTAASPEQSDCEALWRDAGSVAGKQWGDLTTSERTLWRLIGQRFGYSQADVANYLGVVGDESGAGPDPLSQTNLKKIAIVSLNESASKQAAEMIRERTSATVVVVNDLTAGSGTESAKTADVILFVWAATKHAVYRAFDSVRNRIEYVSGRGASSIVLALERWVNRRREP